VFDVLGLGVCSVDDLLYVDDFPAPNGKQRVNDKRRAFGGLTANALVAAQTLGARTAFAGQLGEDEHSQAVLANFRARGVDVQHVLRNADAAPVHSTIIVSNGGRDRAIFPYRPGVYGAPEHWPSPALLRDTRVLFVDHMGAAGQLRAARIAREANIPVVSDLERDESPHFRELLAAIDHAIFSDEFARHLTGLADPTEAVRALHNGRCATVVTAGARGSVSMSDAGFAEHGTLHIETVVDTTGCGDVFHGAYAFALAQGRQLEDRVRIASHAAALKATRIGGQSGPTWEELARTLPARER
jgi:sulfofructose kinase